MRSKERKGGMDLQAFRRVRRFLDRLGGRRPERGELDAIRADLRLLQGKIRRIQKLSPPYRAVDVSEEVASLLVEAGLAPRRLRRLGRAAAS
jgi:hypothetical protein